MTLLLTEIHGAAANLTLNRPERHNSLIPELLTELLTALHNLSDQAHIRAIILRANGKSFSTGGDVKAFYEHLTEIEAYSAEIVSLLNECILAMIACPQPIIAAVQGPVTGGSLGLVLASDLVLVTPQASFTPYYSVVGYSPDGGWTAMLPHVIGAKRALTVQLQNQTITAAQAVEWGMANRVVAADQLEAEAFALAADLTAKIPGSLQHTKQLIWQQLPLLAENLEAERQHFLQQIAQPEARAGMKKFLKL